MAYDPNYAPEGYGRNVLVNPSTQRYIGLAAADPVWVSWGAGMVVDVSDRWARELGQIDLARVLGVALSAANPVISGIYDAAGNRMPAMDVAARSGFQDVIDRWARQVGQVDVARILGAAMTSANPMITGVFDAAGNRMPSMDAAARRGLQEIVTAGALVAAGNPFPTQDTGLNTNPRRYEKDNGFYSAPTARAGGVATSLWTTLTTPARTAGEDTTIYTLVIENSTGAAVTGWLEIGAAAITPPYHVGNNNTIIVDFVAGQDTGNNDIDCNASANGVVFQIIGTEA